MNYTLQFGQVTRYIPDLLAGAVISLELAFLAFCGGMVLGLLGALGKTFGRPWVRRLIGTYVTFFTNTPMLVQIFFIFFVLPDAGIVLSPFVAVLIGMTVNSGAYLTEIQRGGLASVRQSELEAAETLGMSMLQSVRYVIFPHIVRTLFPPLSNQYIIMVLGSSMAAVFGVDELMGRAFSANADSFRSVEIFSITALIYVAITLLVSAVLAVVGRRLFRVRMQVI